ncbi:MAG TPA: hypothetical protein VII11_00235 [Bacteroidota bacterium]
MSFDSPKEKIDYFLQKGIVLDIYLSRLAYSLIMTIGKNGQKLDGTPFQLFFRDIQTLLSDHLIVHITKLFEKPNGRYEIVSVPSVLQYIKEYSSTLEIIEKPLVCIQLKSLGVPDAILSNPSTELLNKIIVDYFDSTLPLIENSIDLQALRILRNKRIAHKEAIDISSRPITTFKNAFELIKFAQNFAIIVGAAYTSTIYGQIGDFFYLGEDAERASNSLEKIFAQLTKVDPTNHF